MRSLVSGIVLLGLLAGAGCQPSPTQSVEVLSETDINPSATPLPETPAEVVATPDRKGAQPEKMPERVILTETLTPIVGEVPNEMLDVIVKDLAKQTGVLREQISVTRAQATVWNDGSLGCPQPGVMYTQALVNGYWVELEVDGQNYDYRATETGYFFICEGGFSPTTPLKERSDS